MEQNTHNELPVIVRPSLHPREKEGTDSSSRAFIEANTIGMDLQIIKDQHIIPVFVKDNEPLISHSEFVDATLELTGDIYHGERILKPIIRVSHPIKGRIPEAKDKPANQLEEWEKTLFYERMMFVIEIPSIQETIGGNTLSLIVGGVKAYNQDNLYSRAQCDQHFKLFIGFQNRVCTNLCVWTDGYMGDLKVKTLNQLRAAIRTLLEGYNQNYHLHHLQKLTEFSITENQFAHLIGRCRMYQHLPSEMKSEIPALLFGDQQIGTVVRDYYRDNSFCRAEDGMINLWNLYNLFTGANKSTYIDNYLDRGINAFNLVEQIRSALTSGNQCWFLN